MLPSLTAAFTIGLLCGSQISFFPLALFILLAVVAVWLSRLERAGHVEPHRALVLYASLLIGILYWSIACSTSPASHTSSIGAASVRATFTGRIVAPVQHSTGRQTILVQTEEFDAISQHVRVVWRDAGITLHHGDRVRVHGSVHPPRGSFNPGGFDYAAYVGRQGINLMTTVTGPEAVIRLDDEPHTDRWKLWKRIDQWRDTIRTAAINTLRQPVLGFFLGITIGDRGYLEQDLQEWFMATGTVHLLSISGSHLGLVAIVVFWAVKRLVLWFPATLLLAMSRTITPSKVAILMTWPAVALYTVLAGAELATTRSLVMITLGMVAVWLGHEHHLKHTMAVALLLIVLHDPQAIFDISFQLSFLSVLVMIAVILSTQAWNESGVPPHEGWTSSVSRHGLKALIISGAVTLVTLPFVAFYFHQVSWMGVITNVIAVPFTGLVLVPLGLVVALSAIMTGSDSVLFSQGLESVFGWMIDGLRWFASFPGSSWRVAAPSLSAMALFYAGLFLASRENAQRRVRMISLCLASALLVWWCVVPTTRGDGDHWRVTFLDVGQGDSAVVELPDGRTVLIDGGARYERFDMGRSVVAPFLWNRGIHHIDYVIGTHQQLDHVGGLIWVLRHLSVGQYWGDGIERSETFVRDLKDVLRQRHIDEHRAVRGQELLQSGPCRLLILNPSEESAAPVSSKPYAGTWLNDQSIVSRLQCGIHSILFAADIETGGLRRLPQDGHDPVTLVKVPHHGARSSFNREWLEQIHPQYAVVSVGVTNPYGHPVASVLQSYEEQGTSVYRTDRDGAIWITGRLSISEFTVTSMHDLIVQPVEFLNCPWRCEYENWHRVVLRYLS